MKVNLEWPARMDYTQPQKTEALHRVLADARGLFEVIVTLPTNGEVILRSDTEIIAETRPIAMQIQVLLDEFVNRFRDRLNLPSSKLPVQPNIEVLNPTLPKATSRLKSRLILP